MSGPDFDEIDEFNRIAKSMYELTASDEQKDFLEFYSNVLGVFYSSLSLGYIPSLPIIQKIQNWAYRRHLRKISRKIITEDKS